MESQYNVNFLLTLMRKESDTKGKKSSERESALRMGIMKEQKLASPSSFCPDYPNSFPRSMLRSSPQHLGLMPGTWGFRKKVSKF